jgi:hypothetical protein
MACITSAPIMLASREKRPPDMDVPPMTTARMASNSVVSPMLLASEVLDVRTGHQAGNPGAEAAEGIHQQLDVLSRLMPLKKLERN